MESTGPVQISISPEKTTLDETTADIIRGRSRWKASGAAAAAAGEPRLLRDTLWNGFDSAALPRLKHYQLIRGGSAASGLRSPAGNSRRSVFLPLDTQSSDRA